MKNPANGKLTERKRTKLLNDLDGAIRKFRAGIDLMSAAFGILESVGFALYRGKNDCDHPYLLDEEFIRQYLDAAIEMDLNEDEIIRDDLVERFKNAKLQGAKHNRRGYYSEIEEPEVF